MIARTAALLTAAVAVFAAGSCSTGSAKGQQATVTVTVDPSTPASSSPSVTTSTAPSPTRTGPTARTTLNGTCETRMPVSAVMAALGRSVAGETSFVVGTAEPDIGRIGYLNCRYGLPTAGDTAPTIEIGVSLYTSPDKAQDRIPATVDDYRAHGAQTSDATVAGHDATILTGATGSGYTAPTIVLAADQRTVAVSIAASATTAATRTADLTRLAEFALQRTAY